MNRIEIAQFKCRNCQRSIVRYVLLFVVTEAAGSIIKIGQWPPLSREPDPIIVAGWDKADLVLYRDAMTFRNSNKGIGALPYLRRIIETHIHQVLDLIADTDHSGRGKRQVKNERLASRKSHRANTWRFGKRAPSRPGGWLTCRRLQRSDGPTTAKMPFLRVADNLLGLAIRALPRLGRFPSS